MSKIILENMEFHAYHGCFDFEKMNGNTFIVNVSMELDTDMAERSDNLEDTLNYQDVYDVIKEEMDIQSNLIEHVARRIHDAILNRFVMINSVEVCLAKKNPPLGGKVDSVKIIL